MYINGSEARLIQTTSFLKKTKKEKRLQDSEEKALHGQWFRHTNKVRDEKSWAWFQNGDLKIIIVSAQNQGKKNNLVKAKIDKS